MQDECIDIFCHCLPPPYVAAADRAFIGPRHMFDRARSLAVMVDVAARFALMDQFPGYRQVLSLASPAPESVAGPAVAIALAQIANDAMAEMVERHRDRFRGFVASLPLNDPDAAVAEAERATRELGAVGAQVFTSIDRKPLNRPEHLSVVEWLVAHDLPIWLHPSRSLDSPDYATEGHSMFDLWWAFGWPHETSLAMGRLVFAGIFDRWPNAVIIAHHGGGTVPMLAGRIESGLTKLGVRNPPELANLVTTELAERPFDAFRRFYVDTATFGSRAAIACSIEFFGASQTLFATDMPFGVDGGAGNIRSTLSAINAMDLSSSDREAILIGSSKRICNIEE